MPGSDQERIEQTIQTRFESMYESDPEKVHQAFYPNARITGYIQGRLREMTVAAFDDLVTGQKPSARERGEPVHLETVSLDRAGETAIGRVRDGYIGLTFLDTLSFLKMAGESAVFNKLFHVES